MVPLLAFDLRVDHRAEGMEQRAKAFGISFQRTQHVHERLDGRHAAGVRFAADAIFAGSARRKGIARESAEFGVFANELFRLPPRAVDHDEGDGLLGRMRDDVDGSFARVEQRRGARRIGEGPRERGRITKIDAHVQLGVGEAQGRHVCGADSLVPLARVLQQNDAGARGERSQVTAVTNARRPKAARAGGARLEAKRGGHPGDIYHEKGA